MVTRTPPELKLPTPYLETKTVYSRTNSGFSRTYPVHIEHTLTKKGKALQSILEEMVKFSTKIYCDDIFKDSKPRTVRQVHGNNLPIIG